eukprot:2702746-Pleurochrysis_carterae.AAC.4
MSQALTTACARLFMPTTREMRNLSRQLQLSPAMAHLAWDNQAANMPMLYCCKTACTDAEHGARAKNACWQRYRSNVLARACASTTGILPCAYR